MCECVRVCVFELEKVILGLFREKRRFGEEAARQRGKDVSIRFLDYKSEREKETERKKHSTVSPERVHERGACK